MPWLNMSSEEKAQDQAEALKNSPLLEKVSTAEIHEHFGIQCSDGQHCRHINNHSSVRDRLMLNSGLHGAKRIVIDFDPEYFCIVWREIPIEPAPSQINP